MSPKFLVDRTIGPGMIGLGLLGASIYMFLEGRLNGSGILGLMVGFAGGYVSAFLLELPRSFPEARWARRVAIATNPVVAFFPLMFVSVPFAGWYFAGAAISFCFSSSVAALKLESHGPGG